MSSTSDTDSDVPEASRRIEPLRQTSRNAQDSVRRGREAATPMTADDGHSWAQRDMLGYGGGASSTSPSRPLRPNHIDPSRYAPMPVPILNMSEEARRQTMIAIDRKRRLTSSTQDNTARRRIPSGGFGEREDVPYNRPLEGYHTTPRLPGSSARPLYGSNSGHEVIDLTSSPPQPTIPPPPSIRRSSASTSSMYIVPRWQPDSEATECPICKRPFSFLFRRHHCRKCGRVVCNDCSPHRITIPRQYIVNPPGELCINGPGGRNTVDLTGDDDDDDGEENEAIFNSSTSIRQSRHIPDANIGGGEKVRLCNPCVPDPQPEQQANYASSPTLNAGPNRRQDLLTLSDALRASRHDFQNNNSLERFPGFVQQHSLPFPAHPTRLHPSLLPPQLRGDLGLQPSQLNAVPYSPADRTRPRSQTSFDNSQIMHHRHFSSESSRMQHQSVNRPRMRSVLEDSYVPRMFPSHVVPPPRQRLSEEDICPVCRRVLPPKGPDNDETARENHIMECISSRDPSLQSSSARGRTTPHSPPRGPMHMLPFVATEKDCVGEDGTVPECSICMVEYDVGDELARLECLCKFHRECITSWFTRKQECPVHKIS